MNLEKRIKELENQVKILTNAFVTVQEATRQGTDSTAKVVREDTQEIINEIQKNVNSFANATGKGLIVTQGNVSTYIEQIDIFKELSDLLEKLNEFFSLTFSANIPQNAPPPWGAQAELISGEIKTLANQLKAVLP